MPVRSSIYHCLPREDAVPRLLSRKTRCQHCLKPLLVLSDHCLRLTYHSICNDINHQFTCAYTLIVEATWNATICKKRNERISGNMSETTMSRVTLANWMRIDSSRRSKKLQTRKNERRTRRIMFNQSLFSIVTILRCNDEARRTIAVLAGDSASGRRLHLRGEGRSRVNFIIVCQLRVEEVE